MAKCINCAAPLPPNTIVCEYCGSRNDTDLTGIHDYTTVEPESRRLCPLCSVPMRTIDLKIQGKFYIERCDTCLGLFFDPGELEVLLKVSVKNVYHINRKKLDSINAVMGCQKRKTTYVKCPECGKLMNRVNFGVRSGVVVDKCTEHGIWLDGGELRHLFEWMKAGGQLLAQEREAELEKEKEREKMKANHKAALPPHDAFHIQATPASPGEVDLLDIVRGVVQWFTH